MGQVDYTLDIIIRPSTMSYDTTTDFINILLYIQFVQLNTIVQD